jgi:CheY-like chemotaxis protein
MATILVVDENQVELRVMRMTLETEGHQVAEARSGLDALDLIRTFAFDLVFVPLDMDGMGGANVIAQTRAMDDRNDTRFVVMLDEHDEKGPVEAFMAGAADLLIKPFGAPDLRDAVARATGEIDIRDRIHGIQLDAYETARTLQDQARSNT